MWLFLPYRSAQELTRLLNIPSCAPLGDLSGRRRSLVSTTVDFHRAHRALRPSRVTEVLKRGYDGFFLLEVLDPLLLAACMPLHAIRH